MHDEHQSSPEVRLVRYARIGSLPAIAMLSISSSGEVIDESIINANHVPIQKAAYEGVVETEGYFTTFGGQVEMSSANVLSTVVVPIREKVVSTEISKAKSTTDWSRTASLASGAEGIRANRSA
ncbi:MAG: hypothetical protein CMJ34_12290 [Phycisphaerae bacterium]|nr:hypothetical protein [Phycisphaerae bacterium]